VETAIEDLKKKKTTENDVVPVDLFEVVGGRLSQNTDATARQHLRNWRLSQGLHEIYSDCFK